MSLQKSFTALLVIGDLALLLSLVPAISRWPRPGSQDGYQPIQPVAFSHRLHAGELRMDCQYCHSGARRSPHAGVPATSICMSCHQHITATQLDNDVERAAALKEGRVAKKIISPKLQPLYQAAGLGPDLQPDPEAQKKIANGTQTNGLQWVRIYDLPDFVRFDHRFHIKADVACQTCHGPVETMERVRHVGSLSMGWCIDCHRDSHGKLANGRRLEPSNDCISCHY